VLGIGRRSRPPPTARLPPPRRRRCFDQHPHRPADGPQSGQLAPRASDLAASTIVRGVIQRVARARSTPGGEIGAGLCVLLGVADGDTHDDAERLAGKVARLRIFENEEGKFDRSLLDVGGEALVVSQFTLIADTAKGNRPSFSGAARPEVAEPLYAAFCEALEAAGVVVARGVFGARMQVELVNDGPVTVVL
jgi:D-aminoacyl-tRNA deacylase